MKWATEAVDFKIKKNLQNFHPHRHVMILEIASMIPEKPPDFKRDEECVNNSNNAACKHRRQVFARACEGWKLVWTDPGPEVKVLNSVVPGPFECPKILKALPYKVVSKCESCAVRDRRGSRNGIPDPWLEYLEREEDNEDPEKPKVRLVKKNIKITDYIWHEKGLALLQGIPDPWKSDLPCECVIKKESKNRRKKSHDKETRRRSPQNERESPRRRSSAREEETPRRKSLGEEESPTRRNISGNEEEPLKQQNANHEEKSRSRRSAICEEFLRRSEREENTKRRSRKCNEEPVRRQNKSEKKTPKNAMCYSVEPFKSAYVCYGGIVPACLRDYFVEVNPKGRSKRCQEKYIKCRTKRNVEEHVRKSCAEEEPVKRRHKNLNVESTKRRSRSCENEIIDCLKSCVELDECRKERHQERQPKSIIKNKKNEQTSRLWDTTSEDSSEVSVEALKKSRIRSDTPRHKVEKSKTCHPPKKLRCGNGFDRVKQRLQELENELKAKGAAKDLQLREMEQLSKMRKKTCKGKKRSGRSREKLGKRKGAGWSDHSDECTNKMRSTWKETSPPRVNYCLKAGEYSVHTDRSGTKEVKDTRTTAKSTSTNKSGSRWLDEPSTPTKKVSKESSKSPKKTDPLRVTSRNTRELKTPRTPLKSIRKDTTSRPVTANKCSPQATTFTRAESKHSTCPTSRRVSYTDEPQPTCRTCSPYHRRVSYCDEAQPPASRASTPCCRRSQASCIGEPVTPGSNLSKSPRCASLPRTSSTASPKESKDSMKKFLAEINSRIEITQDALNSPEMKSVAVQPFQEESKPWRCPGRLLCPRMRERAGGDVFVRRIHVGAADDRNEDDGAEVEASFDEEPVEDYEGSDASDCNAGADRPYRQPPYRRSSMADFKRRQKEIDEILCVESFSERDC